MNIISMMRKIGRTNFELKFKSSGGENVHIFERPALFLDSDEQKRLKDELRSLFLLYGADGIGQWERLQATIASARAEHRRQLKEQKRIQDRNLLITCLTVVVIIGLGAIILFVKYLKNDLTF